MAYVVTGLIIVGGATLILLFFITRDMRARTHAFNLFYAKNYKKAREAFIALIDSEPANPRYPWYLAQISEALGEYDDAVRYYKKVQSLVKYPEDFSKIDVHKKLASLYISLENIDAAEKEINSIMAISPKDVGGLLKIAELAYSQNKHAKAIETANNLLSMNANTPKARKLLGMCYYKTGDIERAYATLKTYVSMIIKGNDEEACYTLGIIARDKENYDEAIEFFSKCSNSPVYGGDALLEMGSAYAIKGDPVRSSKMFELALKTETLNQDKILEALYSVADIKQKAGRLGDAIKNWEKIYSLDPNYKDVAAKITMFEDVKKSEESMNLMALSKEDFEQVIKNVIKKLGYSISGEADSPKENILIYKGETVKDGQSQSAIVYVSKSTRAVGGLQIKELISLVQENRSAWGVYIAPTVFTEEAVKLSEVYPIQIVDCEEMEKVLAKIRSKNTSVWI